MVWFLLDGLWWILIHVVLPYVLVGVLGVVIGYVWGRIDGACEER